jgi:filamentous hemagglutinin family protein
MSLTRTLILSLPVAGTLISTPLPTPAQIQPDDTLGTENSQVIRDVEIRGVSSDRVEGGAIRGNHLFHSFSEFNIQQGRGAYFANPESITNIFTRVTGANPSQINGTLGVLGNANLFFLNPNGIIFGSGASLDLRGAFVATTGSNFLFPDGSKFGTINPQTAPILSVNVTAPVGVELASNGGGRILVQGSQLNVAPQQTLALIGGEINQQGGSLVAPSGNITLISLAEEGLVEWDQNVSFQGKEETATGKISLSEGAFVNSIGAGGEIYIETGSLTLSSNSSVTGGISSQSNDPEASGGDIIVKSQQQIIINNSTISNRVQQGGVGNSGNINLETKTLTLQNSGGILSTTAGDGNAGEVNLIATEKLELLGASRNGIPSQIRSQVFPNGKGNADQVRIETSLLSLKDFSVIGTSSRGEGNAGDINITATAKMELLGGDQVNAGSVVSVVDGKGKGGRIKIETSALSLQDGGAIFTTSFGQGDAGEIEIAATEKVELLGEGVTNGFASALLSQVSPQAEGNAGSIRIETSLLSLQDGGQISTTTFGQGDAGEINVTATEKVTLSGEGQVTGFASEISSAVSQGAVGKGGAVTIETRVFSVENGGLISTSTNGVGDAGEINITAAEKMELIGQTAVSGFPSEVSTQVFSEGEGEGGQITIETKRFLLDAALVSAGTMGMGDGGIINLRATESVEILGNGFSALQERVIIPALEGKLTISSLEPGINTVSNSTGNAGNITIETSDFTASKGGLLAATTLSTGEGGNITIEAQDLITLEDSLLATGTFNPNTEEAISGNVTLIADRLIARGGAQALTSTFGASDAGKVIVRVHDSIELFDPTNQGALLATGLFAATSQQSSGEGGDIDIITEDLTVRDQATVTVSAEGSGKAGNILITAENLTLDEGSITATTFSADGGNINLTINDTVSLTNNSAISATAGIAQEAGNGGNITIDTGFLISQDNSDITANAFEGDGGNITLIAEGILGITPREEITPLSDITASSEFGQEGVIEIETPETDPASTLTTLPEEEVNVEFARACARSPEQSLAFSNLGKGGLPPTPDRFLPITEGVEWLVLPSSESDDRAESVTTQPVSFFAQPLFSTCASQESTPPN